MSDERNDNPHIGERFDLAEFMGDESEQQYWRNVITILREPLMTESLDVLTRFELELARAGLGGWDDNE